MRVIDYERIVASVPLNKTAAAVTAQGAGETELEPWEIRNNIKKLLHQVQAAIDSENITPERRKFLGVQKFKLQQKLSSLPKKITGSRDLGNFIIEVFKERVTRAAYQSVVEEAQRRFQSAEDAQSERFATQSDIQAELQA